MVLDITIQLRPHCSSHLKLTLDCHSVGIDVVHGDDQQTPCWLSGLCLFFTKVKLVSSSPITKVQGRSHFYTSGSPPDIGPTKWGNEAISPYSKWFLLMIGWDLGIWCGSLAVWHQNISERTIECGKYILEVRPVVAKKRVTKKGILMDYVSESCDLPKKKNLMACVSDFRAYFGIELLKKVIFDGTHISKKDILIAYVGNPKTHFCKITKRGKFDGLYKQLMDSHCYKDVPSPLLTR